MLFHSRIIWQSLLLSEIRVRSLYPYEGQRDADLSFAENVVIVAHPAKDPDGEWWYGTTVKSGEKGWFPHSFVSELGSEYRIVLACRISIE